MVDIGGQRVAAEVASGDGPPVVLVSSQGSAGAEWQAVTQLLTTQPTLISYDRPATGASPPRPAPPTALQRVRRRTCHHAGAAERARADDRGGPLVRQP